MLYLAGLRRFEITYFELHNEDRMRTALLLSRYAPYSGAELRAEEICRGTYMENKEPVYG